MPGENGFKIAIKSNHPATACIKKKRKRKKVWLFFFLAHPCHLTLVSQVFLSV